MPGSRLSAISVSKATTPSRPGLKSLGAVTRTTVHKPSRHLSGAERPRRRGLRAAREADGAVVEALRFRVERHRDEEDHHDRAQVDLAHSAASFLVELRSGSPEARRPHAGTG